MHPNAPDRPNADNASAFSGFRIGHQPSRAGPEDFDSASRMMAIEPHEPRSPNEPATSRTEERGLTVRIRSARSGSVGDQRDPGHVDLVDGTLDTRAQIGALRSSRYGLCPPQFWRGRGCSELAPVRHFRRSAPHARGGAERTRNPVLDPAASIAPTAGLHACSSWPRPEARVRPRCRLPRRTSRPGRQQP